MALQLPAVGVREAKNRFSALSTEVNETGSVLVVLKNNRPWVTIHPADVESKRKRERLERFRALTQEIERDGANEPAWSSDDDAELLHEERMRRYG